jgi:hypothetical protein
MTFYEIWFKALELGEQAGKAVVPEPMHVNGIKYSEGVCGFAGIIFDPANQPFVRWIKQEYPQATHKHYRKGREYFVLGFGQSAERKKACAEAMCAYLQEHGVQCSSWSRLD